MECDLGLFREFQLFLILFFFFICNNFRTLEHNSFRDGM